MHSGLLWADRVKEYGAISIAVLSALLFGALMAISTAMGGDHRVTSGSAVAEYVVFVSFIALNLYGTSLMVYIANWYSPTGPDALWRQCKDT